MTPRQPKVCTARGQAPETLIYFYGRRVHPCLAFSIKGDSNMRKIIIAACFAGLGACAHSNDNAEVREITRSNAQQATADAARIGAGAEADRDSRSAACYVLIGLSRDAGGNSGYDAVAMQQAQSQLMVDLRSRLSRAETDQFLASTQAVLAPAAAAERDRAANWCVQNAPETDPEG